MTDTEYCSNCTNSRDHHIMNSQAKEPCTVPGCHCLDFVSATNIENLIMARLDDAERTSVVLRMAVEDLTETLDGIRKALQ